MVTRDVFPGEHSGPGTWRTTKRTVVFDSWQQAGKQIATLDPATEVQVRNGVIVVEKPDQVRVTKPIKNMNLVTGDVILRYAYFGEGESDLWAKGCWYGRADAGYISEVEGTGCHGSQCSAKVIKAGVKTWWLQIQLLDGRSGWTKREDLVPWR
jgi:hypothetical protein